MFQFLISEDFKIRELNSSNRNVKFKMKLKALCCLWFSSSRGGGRSENRGAPSVQLLGVVWDRRVCSCWDVRIFYCRRLLRIDIQCLLLIKPKHMHYLVVTHGPLSSIGTNFVISLSSLNKNIGHEIFIWAYYLHAFRHNFLFIISSFFT